MSPREQIEQKRDEVRELCDRLGIPALTAHFDEPDSWKAIRFVADLDVSRLKGYADRFFDLDEGLLRIFNRRVYVIEKQIFERQSRRSGSEHDVELLRAS